MVNAEELIKRAEELASAKEAAEQQAQESVVNKTPSATHPLAGTRQQYPLEK